MAAINDGLPAGVYRGQDGKLYNWDGSLFFNQSWGMDAAPEPVAAAPTEPIYYPDDPLIAAFNDNLPAGVYAGPDGLLYNWDGTPYFNQEWGFDSGMTGDVFGQRRGSVSPSFDSNAGSVFDANAGNAGAVIGGVDSGGGSTTGIPQGGNANTGSQTAPTGPTGTGGNTAPGASAGDSGQSSVVDALQRNSLMDFNKGGGGLLTSGPIGRTVGNSATGIVQRSALTPITAQQAKLGIPGKRPGMLSV